MRERTRKPKVEPPVFATPFDIELPRSPFFVDRLAADLATALRAAHTRIAEVLARVPAGDREAVLSRVERPIHQLLDVVEQLAPAPRAGWRPTVIDGGRDA